MMFIGFSVRCFDLLDSLVKPASKPTVPGIFVCCHKIKNHKRKSLRPWLKYIYLKPLACSITPTRLAVGLEQWNVLRCENAAPRKLVPPRCFVQATSAKKVVKQKNILL